MPRPRRPDQVFGDRFFDFPSDVRSRLNMYWHALMDDYWAERAGLRRASDGEGGHMFCPECFANSGEIEPVRGLDSYGDCAEDDESTFMVVPLSTGAP